MPAELTAAIREAKQRLEETQTEAASESRERQAKIAEETKQILGLREEEKNLGEKLRALHAELQGLEGKSAQRDVSVKTVAAELQSVRDKVKEQATKLGERVASSLVTTQDEQILSAVSDLREEKSQAVGEQLKVVLELFQRVLGYARTSAMVQRPIRMPQAGDRIQSLKVLRFGLLGGYFSNVAAREAGFVVADPGSKVGFVAESRGLTSTQQLGLIVLLQRPDKGGFLPADVTGGAVLSTRREKEDVVGWFHRGGPWMWPLLAVAAAALLIAIERMTFLVAKSVAVPRRLLRAVTLIETGRVEMAASESPKASDATGRVLRAAFATRTLGRGALELAVGEATLRGADSFQARIGWMAIAAALAPLVGFLGTVSTLAARFDLFSAPAFAGPFTLALGFADALVPLQAGLYVAVPCLLLRGLLWSLAESVAGKLESGAMSVEIALLKLNQESEAPVGVGEPV